MAYTAISSRSEATTEIEVAKSVNRTLIAPGATGLPTHQTHRP